MASHANNWTTDWLNGLRKNDCAVCRRRGECHAMGSRLGSRRNPKRTVSPEDYAVYIKSPEWKAQRRRYWQSNMPKHCYGCGLPWLRFVQGMHLHHRAYHNLGNERLIDLQPLCEGCHRKVHEIVNDNRRRLWKAGLLLKRHHLIAGLYNIDVLRSHAGSNEFRKWTDPFFLAKMRRRWSL